VHEAYADGHEGDPDLVRAHMMAARERERKGLML
jgi:hypothetical protein